MFSLTDQKRINVEEKKKRVPLETPSSSNLT